MKNMMNIQCNSNKYGNITSTNQKLKMFEQESINRSKQQGYKTSVSLKTQPARHACKVLSEHKHWLFIPQTFPDVNNGRKFPCCVAMLSIDYQLLWVKTVRSGKVQNDTNRNTCILITSTSAFTIFT